jgi:hypothetical protein
MIFVTESELEDPDSPADGSESDVEALKLTPARGCPPGSSNKRKRKNTPALGMFRTNFMRFLLII